VRVIGEEFATVLARAQEGDEVAFATLWRDLNPALLRYLSVSGDPADDVASETWMSVVKGLPRFRGEEIAWRAWVFTTARRRATDQGRRRTRVATHDREWHRSVMDPGAQDPADATLERIGTDEALRLVAQLPRVQAEVIMLRVVAGLPAVAVAAVLGRSPGAVRVATHRGLQGLKALLDERGVTQSRPDALHPAT
jgi:RNA polymerase sigma-70 factor (ECF subfamily)